MVIYLMRKGKVEKPRRQASAANRSWRHCEVQSDEASQTS
jgi:hypothetical protein